MTKTKMTAHVHYDRGSKSSFAMNRRPGPVSLTPRGHFPRVCFDSKFPVKLVTGTGSLSDPAQILALSLSLSLSLARPACEFSAPLDTDALQVDEIFLGTRI